MYPMISDIEFSEIAYSDPKTMTWTDPATSQQKTSFPTCYAQKNKNEPVEIWFQSSEPSEDLLDSTVSPERFNAAKLDLLGVESVFHLQDQATAKYPCTDGKHLVMWDVPESQAKYYQKLDALNRSYIEANAKTLFKSSNLPPSVLAQTYKPLYGPDNYAKKNVLRIKMQPETRFLVHNGGEEFLPGDLTHLRKGCRCLVAMKYKGIYFQAQQAGAVLEAYQIYIFPGDNLGKTGKVSFGGRQIRVAQPAMIPPSPDTTFEPELGGSAQDVHGWQQPQQFDAPQNSQFPGDSQFTEKTVVGGFPPTASAGLPPNSIAGGPAQTPPVF